MISIAHRNHVWYIFTYISPMKINHSCRVNIPFVPWILWVGKMGKGWDAIENQNIIQAAPKTS